MMTPPRQLGAWLVVAVVAALCGPALGRSATAATAVAVVKDFAFSPATLDVHPGEQVVWRNEGTIPHSVTLDDGSYDNTVAPGDLLELQFPRAGTFTYHCKYHTQMVGTIAVVDPAATSSTTTTTTAATSSTTTTTTIRTTTTTTTPSTTTTVASAPLPQPVNRAGRSGYWALSSDGHVHNFGDAAALGDAAAGAVDLEPTLTGNGYWVLNGNGTVQAFGDAAKLGDVDRAKLATGEEPASLSATPTGQGYWVFTNRGRAIPFGDAPFLGDMSGTTLNGPVLGSVATPSGQGYYMVASDGGIFAFGDAIFDGSMGGKKLNAPVQSLVPDGDGHGYWLVAADGGIFAFDAPFRGSMGATKLNKPVVGMVRYGDGYLMVGADGGIFNFSTSPFAGSLGDKPPAAPVVAVGALP